VKDFRKLQIWQKSHRLTLELYELTRAFPRDEIYGLTAQIRRASSSIAANLAEGCGTEMRNWHASALSLEARPASWNTTSCWLTI
jgi:four helix bundle protein